MECLSSEIPTGDCVFMTSCVLFSLISFSDLTVQTLTNSPYPNLFYYVKSSSKAGFTITTVSCHYIVFKASAF